MIDLQVRKNEILLSMVRIGEAAREVHCRVKEWKLRKSDAMVLAIENSPTARPGIDVYEAMERGEVQIMGAKIRVI
jgi:hypothetical protein